MFFFCCVCDRLVATPWPILLESRPSSTGRLEAHPRAKVLRSCLHSAFSFPCILLVKPSIFYQGRICEDSVFCAIGCASELPRVSLLPEASFLSVWWPRLKLLLPKAMADARPESREPEAPEGALVEFRPDRPAEDSGKSLWRSCRPSTTVCETLESFPTCSCSFVVVGFFVVKPIGEVPMGKFEVLGRLGGLSVKLMKSPVACSTSCQPVFTLCFRMAIGKVAPS